MDRILQLERKYIDKPSLHNALVMGQISVNKLVKIASIATNENQKELINKAEILSCRALEVYLKDLKSNNQNISEIKHKNSQQKPLFEPQTVHVNSLKLDLDIENQLLEMQGKNINVNEFLRECLQQRTQQIQTAKEQLSQEVKQTKNYKDIIGMPTSRYISVNIRKVITQEYGTKCSRNNCHKPAKQLHHEKRFSTEHDHDPMNLKPLCTGHHELEHAYEANYQRFRNTSRS